MARYQFAVALLCTLLLTHSALAVVNSAASKAHDDDNTTNNESSSSNNHQEDSLKDNVTAEDRISDVYGAPPQPQPAETYGPPPGDSFVPPPQPQQQPQINPHPVYGPPELTGVAPIPPNQIPELPADPLPPVHGPPQPFNTYGPPQPPQLPPRRPSGNYGPPRNFRPKPAFGPPPPPPPQKFGPPPRPQFGGPPPPQRQRLPRPTYGPPFKNGGSPVPVYGPPPAQPPQTFNPPPSGPPVPVYGPPPTQGRPVPVYGPPQEFHQPAPLPGPILSIPPTLEEYGPPRSSAFPFQQPQHQEFHQGNDIFGAVPPPPSGVAAPPTPPDIKYDGWQPIAGFVQQPPVPSNGNYQFLQQDDNHGRLNDQPAPTVIQTTNVPSNSYGEPLPNPDDHNLRSQVGQSDDNGLPPPPLPQLPNNNINIHDSYGTPVDPANESFKSAAALGGESENDGLPPPPLPQFEPLHDVRGPADPNQFAHHHQQHQQATFEVPQLQPGPNFVQNDIPLGQPQNTYGPPPPPPPPRPHFVPQQPPQSYGPPYRGGTGFTSNTFNKIKNHFRNHIAGGYRPPQSLPGTMIPPRRPPTKFRDTVPNAIMSSLNKYLPPRPHNSYGPPNNGPNPGLIAAPSSSHQLLPALSAPTPFHHHDSAGASASATAFAAPNVNYGTPLSFNDFNTPAPGLTYGAPNFLPPTPMVNQGNLYNQIDLPQRAYGHDCNHQTENTASYQFTIDHSAGQYDALASPSLNSVYTPPAVSSVTNFLGQPNTHHEGPVLDLDARTNYRSQHPDSIGASDQSADISQTVQEAPIQNSNSIQQQDQGISAEALTAALTAQGYGEAKQVVQSQEVDPAQFIRSPEGSEVMAILTNDADGSFQIQGSRGTYSLQIQPADGGYGTANSDGSIPHEKLLSDGLLQNILAAIEQQPQGGQLQFDNPSELQVLQQPPQPQPTEQVVQQSTTVEQVVHQQPAQQERQPEVQAQEPQQQQQRVELPSTAAQQGYQYRRKSNAHHQTSRQSSAGSKQESSHSSAKSEEPSSDEDKVALYFSNYGKKIKERKSTSAATSKQSS